MESELSDAWKLMIDILGKERLIGFNANRFIGVLGNVIAIDHHDARVGMRLRSPFVK